MLLVEELGGWDINLETCEMRLDRYFNEANLRFNMDSLLADCREVKGDPLSAEECLFYRAAACGAAIQDAAKFLNWKLSTARVFVSRSVKAYVRALIESQGLLGELCGGGKMSWHQLPHIFARLGYERAKVQAESDLFEMVSSRPCEVSGRQLIAEYNEKLWQIKFAGEPSMLPSDFAGQMEAGIQQAVARAQACPAKSEGRLKAYLDAIKYYRFLLMEDPVGQVEQGVKIAQTLSMIGRYADSVPMALELMGHVKTKEAKAKLNFVLAMAYERVALKQLDDHYRQQSIQFYQAAIDWGEERNCIALYNVFDLNFQFLLKMPEGGDYLMAARMALRRFIEELDGSRSNFYRYKPQIQGALKEKLEQTDDAILLKDIGVILEW